MGHHHNHNEENSKNILLAIGLNFSFAIIEIIGGFYTNSVAILSDALHDLGDSFSLTISYFLEKISHKAPDKKFTYGYRRFSLLAALLNGMILTLGSLFVVKEAIERVFNPEVVKPEGMLILAFLGIIVNGIAALKISKGKSLNQKMILYHLLEDIFGWVSVLIVSIVLFFWPFYILDSILSILISAIILRGVYVNIKKVLNIFLLKFPDDISINHILEEITKIENVLNIHYVKGWAIDESNTNLTFHVTLPKDLTISKMDKIKIDIKKILGNHEIFDSIIEFESEDYICQ